MIELMSRGSTVLKTRGTSYEMYSEVWVLSVAIIHDANDLDLWLSLADLGTSFSYQRIESYF